MTKKRKGSDNIPQIDPKYINVPNINFSLTDSTDKREKKFRKQRFKRGFDDSETWAMDCTFAEFMIPRLERYLVVADEVIVIEPERMKDYKKILRALRLIIRDDGGQCWTKKEIKQIRKGLKLLSQHFLTLGW